MDVADALCQNPGHGGHAQLGALRSMLAQKGFDPMMGARPMLRLIQDLVRKALADELLFGRLSDGGKVTVDVDSNDNVRLIFEDEDPPPSKSNLKQTGSTPKLNKQ